MALSRRRDASIIWPGFVDAVTTLLMVLMFVLTIFTMMQATLRDQLTTQGTELDALTAQVAGLADALGLERARAAGLADEIGALQANLAAALAEGDRQGALIATLTADLAAREADLTAAEGRITEFEAQVAALLLQRDTAQGEVARLMTEAEAQALALAQARDEILAAEEAARLDAAAAAALRDRLADADTELTAMTLALEAERKRAEETLTLLAGARVAAEAGGTALAVAEAALLAERDKVLAAAREVELLNQQVAALRAQLGTLQATLDDARARDAAAQVQLETLGSDLNAALAQVAAEQKARAELEAAEAARLAAENQDLARYRSEFFGQLSTLLAGREGVRVVGDRFIFSSEVLFNAGSADLSPEGRAQIAGVVRILDEVRQNIPEGIDWIIRVDGHTDNVPLSGTGAFADNWELSQARALSVVRFMQDDLGFPPDRMAAAGFGEYRPVALGEDEAARAQNRRIELKLTER